MKPQLGVVQQIEGGERDLLVLRRTTHVEIALAAVEPGQGVAGAIEFLKFELVGHSAEVTSGGSIVIPALSPTWLMWWSRAALCTGGALCPDQLVNGRVQFLLLGRLVLNGGLKSGHLVLQRLERLHLEFDGVQVAQNGVEGGIDVAGGTGGGLQAHHGGSAT
jgi:hypothetical protein